MDLEASLDHTRLDGFQLLFRHVSNEERQETGIFVTFSKLSSSRCSRCVSSAFLRRRRHKQQQERQEKGHVGQFRLRIRHPTGVRNRLTDAVRAAALSLVLRFFPGSWKTTTSTWLWEQDEGADLFDLLSTPACSLFICPPGSAPQPEGSSSAGASARLRLFFLCDVSLRLGSAAPPVGTGGGTS